LLACAFLFGPSMDYEVFILSRIREKYDRTRLHRRRRGGRAWPHRAASVMSVGPARRRALMARVRMAAMIRGPDRVRACDLSSWFRVSRPFSGGQDRHKSGV